MRDIIVGFVNDVIGVVCNVMGMLLEVDIIISKYNILGLNDGIFGNIVN